MNSEMAHDYLEARSLELANLKLWCSMQMMMIAFCCSRLTSVRNWEVPMMDMLLGAAIAVGILTKDGDFSGLVLLTFCLLWICPGLSARHRRSAVDLISSDEEEEDDESSSDDGETSSASSEDFDESEMDADSEDESADESGEEDEQNGEEEDEEEDESSEEDSEEREEDGGEDIREDCDETDKDSESSGESQ